MSEQFPEVRISPDGRNVAIRNRDSKTNPWRVTNGGFYADTHVVDWTPMVPATALVAELQRDVKWLQAWRWPEAANMLRERIVELREIVRGAA